jgi:hypothetical protein
LIRITGPPTSSSICFVNVICSSISMNFAIALIPLQRLQRFSPHRSQAPQLS